MRVAVTFFRPIPAVAALVLAAVLAWTGATAAASAGTLDVVRERGTLLCGTSSDNPGFSEQLPNGSWRGFHVDFCRALAAAVLGDADAVAFVALSDKERFPALSDGTVDLLSRDTEWTMSRDVTLDLAFPAVTYFDGQGFMIGRDLGLASAIELSGTPICVLAGSLAELQLARYFRRQNMAYNPVAVESMDDVLKAYGSGDCRAISADVSFLHALRLTLAEPGANVILPEIISRKPVGPVVRKGDEGWFDIVRWTHFALVNAEELGVTKKTVDGMIDSADQEIRNLLGSDGTLGASLGLADGWAADAIRAVGNYGEIYDRNLGAGSDLDVARGLNALWRDDGLQYAPPMR